MSSTMTSHLMLHFVYTVNSLIEVFTSVDRLLFTSLSCSVSLLLKSRLGIGIPEQNYI